MIKHLSIIFALMLFVAGCQSANMMKHGNVKISQIAPTSQKQNVAKIVIAKAKKHKVPADLALAVTSVESKFNCKARGSSGEKGAMQVMRRTARSVGHKGSHSKLYQCKTGIEIGMRVLKKCYTAAKGSYAKTVACYNAGEGRTHSKRLPKVTRKYISKVKKITKKNI